MRVWRGVAGTSRLAAGLLLLVGWAVSGCGAYGSSVDQVHGPRLLVGIDFAKPGLSQRTGSGRFAGFEVDVARYVARELGVDERAVQFVEVPRADRETVLRQRKVDLVVDGFAITPARGEQVDFAGPYFVAGQTLLTRKGDTDIVGPESLDHSDWKLCSVAGTTAADEIKRRFAPSVVVREYASEQRCIRALDNRDVDAVTADDVVLAGYVAQQPDKYRLAGQQFSAEQYGIGLRQDDPRQPAVTAALRKLVADGTWQRIVTQDLGPSHYPIPEPPDVLDRP